MKKIADRKSIRIVKGILNDVFGYVETDTPFEKIRLGDYLIKEVIDFLYFDDKTNTYTLSFDVPDEDEEYKDKTHIPVHEIYKRLIGKKYINFKINDKETSWEKDPWGVGTPALMVSVTFQDALQKLGSYRQFLDL